MGLVYNPGIGDFFTVFFADDPPSGMNKCENLDTGILTSSMCGPHLLVITLIYASYNVEISLYELYSWLTNHLLTGMHSQAPTMLNMFPWHLVKDCAQ